MSSRQGSLLVQILQIWPEMKRRDRETAGIWDSAVLHVFRPICVHPDIPRVSPRFPRSVDTAHGHA